MRDEIERPPSLLGLLSFLTASVSKGLRGKVQAALAEHDLDTPLFGVLVALDDFGVLSQQELADRLDADKSHVMRLIDQLEQRGLLTRSPDPTDRRRHRIQLTPDGRTLAQRTTRSVADAEDDYLRALPSADRRRLMALLQQVLESHDGPATAD